ncbi:MAG: hypothetical protein V2A73_18500, partial [Pseudomonadota bacterium]
HLLEHYPDFADAPRISYLIAAMLRHEGQVASALERLRTTSTKWQDSEWGLRARKLEGDLLLATGDLSGAELAYLALRGRQSSVLNETIEAALARVETARWLKVCRTGSVVVVVAFVLIFLVAVGRKSESWKSREGILALVRPTRLQMVTLVTSFPFLLGCALALPARFAFLGTIRVASTALVLAWLGMAALKVVFPPLSGSQPRGKRMVFSLMRAGAWIVPVLALLFVELAFPALSGQTAVTSRHAW